MEIKFTIPGKPVPAVRMTQNEVKLVRYIPKSTALQKKRERILQYLNYKDAIAWTAKAAGIKIFNNPSVKIFIYYSGLGGDWDNYGKTICDALKGLAWEDDRVINNGQVIKTKVPKGKEYAEVIIKEA